MAVRCLRCGAQVEGLQQFCDDCAATQPRSAYEPVPPAVDPAGATRSVSASAGAQRHCFRCGSLVPAEAGFCPGCGEPVSGGPRAGMAYAGFWIRLLATIVDSIIMGTINAAIAFAFQDLATAIGLQFVAGVLYTIGFWVAVGATPGKLALNMEIVMEDGTPLTGGAAVLRYIGYFVNVLTLGIGYLMVGFTAQKRGLHDYLAGTVVVRRG